MQDINMSESEFRGLSSEDRRKTIVAAQNGTLNDEVQETEQTDVNEVQVEAEDTDQVNTEVETEAEADEVSEGTEDVPSQFKGKTNDELEKIARDQDTYKKRQQELIDQIMNNNREISRTGNQIGEAKKQKEVKAVIKQEDDLLSGYEDQDVQAVEQIIARRERMKQEKQQQTLQSYYSANLDYENNLKALNPTLHDAIIPKAIEEVKKNPNLLYSPNWLQTYVMKEVTNVLSPQAKKTSNTTAKKKKAVAAGSSSSRTQKNVNLLTANPRNLTKEQRIQQISLLRQQQGLR